MKDLIKQNYEITKQRELIDQYTTNEEFVNKIHEEYTELILSLKDYDESFMNPAGLRKYPSELPYVGYELSDIILVCMNFATHLGIDIEQSLKEKIEINRKRIQ